MLIAVAGWIKTIAERELLPEQNLELDDEEQDFWIISTEIRRDNAPPKIDGAQLITVERNEQIKKHGRSVEKDVIENDKKQLSIAAGWLCYDEEGCLDMDEVGEDHCPDGWNLKLWSKMCNKLYKERLIIAGALIAAEIDRLQYLDNTKQ